MRLVVNYALGLLVLVLYAVASVAILYGALATPGYEPAGFRGDLFDLTVGGIVAFLAATLGLAVANDQTTVGGSLRMATAGDPAKGGGEWLIAVVGAAYVLIGVCFVVVSVFPELVAVEDGAKSLADAPDYLTTQARAFVGVALAGLASVGAALRTG